MQLRDPSSLASEAYVAQRAWQEASLRGCPRHPRGGCGFARHGTYPRQTPAGIRIARYDCPTAHETFSLLPDCLAGRFPGDLDDLERVVAHVEVAPSLEAAADVLRPDIVLIIALLDDATRISPAAAFARNATVTAFLPVFEQAVRRRGVCKR